MKNIDLDIDMLRCFVEVANTTSFTKAGKNIGLTQSGVSVKIRRLEERLDTQIFNRSTKQLSLTNSGELLLEYAEKILLVHDEAVIRLTEPYVHGELRVGLIDYFLPELLPSLLSKFKQKYPHIHLKVQTDVGMNLIPLYEKGELDLVVAGKDSWQAQSIVLAQEPLVWVTNEKYELTADAPLPLILLPSPCNFRKIALSSLDKIGRVWDIVFTGTSISGLQAAILAGMGIAVLPKGALKKGLKIAPAHLNLPKLPMYSIALITNFENKSEIRDVFVRYLEEELASFSTT